MKLLPMGSKLLVIPQKRKEQKTEAGIDVTNNELNEGIVVEVSDDFKDIYKPGDVVLYSYGAGQGEFYQGKQCVWIDGRSPNMGGDVWAILTDDMGVDTESAKGFISEVKYLDERDLNERQ